MLPGLICWQIVGSSGSIGKSVKPSGELSVVQVQQRNHGNAADGADGREKRTKGPIDMERMPMNESSEDELNLL